MLENIFNLSCEKKNVFINIKLFIHSIYINDQKYLYLVSCMLKLYSKHAL